jgi:hypothetical protein
MSWMGCAGRAATRTMGRGRGRPPACSPCDALTGAGAAPILPAAPAAGCNHTAQHHCRHTAHPLPAPCRSCSAFPPRPPLVAPADPPPAHVPARTAHARQLPGPRPRAGWRQCGPFRSLICQPFLQRHACRQGRHGVTPLQATAVGAASCATKLERTPRPRISRPTAGRAARTAEAPLSLRERARGAGAPAQPCSRAWWRGRLCRTRRRPRRGS